MAGLPFDRMGQSTPESIVHDYLQKGLQDIQQRYNLQWDEVNRRGKTLGRRRQGELFDELDLKVEQDALAFQQKAQQQMGQFTRIDKLAQQGGFDPYEAKMRMVLSPEEQAAMFPKKEAPRSTAAQFGELDVYEHRLKQEAGEFITDPGGKRIKDPWKWRWQEKKTQPLLKVYDPNLDPTYDEKAEKWTKGGYRTATQEDIRRKLLIDRELATIRERKEELLGQPDIATRVRGAILGVKRDKKYDSFDTRVQDSIPKPAAPRAPERPRGSQPERQTMTPPVEYPDAAWNDKHRVWTVVRNGRLMGVK